MAKSFLVPINLNQLELQNARIQNLASAPASPVKGQVYFNTTTNKAMVYDGTNWIPWEADTNTVTGVKGNSESTYRTGNVNITAANVGAVPTTRTVNSKALSSDITLTASDVGAATTEHVHGFISNQGRMGDGANISAGAGDRILISDDSNAGKISRLVNAFDGSTTSKALTAKGTFETFVTLSTTQSLTNKTYNGYTLADAAAKDVDDSISSGSTSTKLPTSAAVASFVSSEIGAVDAMRFKGTLGTGGTVTDLPTTGVKVGDTYRVITAGTYASIKCEVGDLVIATATTPTWTVAQTNIDGAITASTTTTNGYLAKFTGDKIVANGPQLGSSTTTYLNNAGNWATPPDTKVTAVGNHYTPSGGTTTSASGATGSAGTTVQVVTGITKDAAGHVTGITSGAATDTRNTAGSTDSSSKLFLIGATSQAANPQTYSHDTAYVGTDGCLYSGGTKVLTAHQTYTQTTGKPTANQTPGFGSTFTISQISQATSGQISATDRTVKIPNATATTSAAGLMSAADKTKLDDLANSNIVRCITGSITAGQTSGTITTPVNGEPIGLTAFDNNFNEIIVDWVLVANNDSTCTVTASIASAVSYNIALSCTYAVSSNL